MTPSSRRFSLAVALVAVCPSLACGGDEPPPPAKQPREAPAKADPPPIAGGSTGGGSTGAGDTLADEGGWDELDDDSGSGSGSGGSGDSGGDATGGEDAAPVRYVGPCTVSWSKAARLRFTYDDDGKGGSVRIDGDRDGKSDVCATFQLEGDRTVGVEVDEGCDRKKDLTIAPSYDESSNVATATFDDGGEPRELTLVALPSFSGVAPGYPLYAAKKDVKLSITKGLVRSATVKKPDDGPPLKATFTYDAEGRIKRVSEDHDLDGSIDRKFDYRYDDAGNVKGVTLTMGPKGEETKSTAALGYGCWKETDKDAK